MAFHHRVVSTVLGGSAAVIFSGLLIADKVVGGPFVNIWGILLLLLLPALVLMVLTAGVFAFYPSKSRKWEIASRLTSVFSGLVILVPCLFGAIA